MQYLFQSCYHYYLELKYLLRLVVVAVTISYLVLFVAAHSQDLAFIFVLFKGEFYSLSEDTQIESKEL